jgi:predicted nucleic acid-binding Zn ribbon protein
VRPLTHAVPGALLLLLRNAQLSDGKVHFAWGAAVGPAVARATRVKLDEGVLIVETASRQWSREIERSSAVILHRLQSYLGDETIARIDVRTVPNPTLPI